MARYQDDTDEPQGLMQQRLRVARGETYDEPYDDDGVEEYDDEPVVRSYVMPINSGAGCVQSLIYTAAVVVVLGLVTMLIAPKIIGNMAVGLPQSVAEGINEVVASPTPTLRDRGGTITQIQALNRIETLQFSVERVVEAGTEQGDWRDLLLGEKLLLIASGDVIAGVDMSRLRASDIVISPDGEAITIQLPPSEIFSARLNNERTRVYNRETRLGTQLIGGEDPTLETQARQAAESEILKAACEGDVMNRAAAEAKRSVTQFLGLLDFTTITINAPAGPCVAPGTPPS